MVQNYRKKARLKSDPEFIPMRWSQLFEDSESKDINSGVDLREPKYRREFFLKFYEFHLMHRSHPGCVYYIFPYVWEKLKMDQEQKLWFSFINGCTQNPCTTYAITQVFPDLNSINLRDMEDWHSQYWRRLDYDTDKRYSKGHLLANVKNYLAHLDGRTQIEFFGSLTDNPDPELNFWPVWNKVLKEFHLFGRLGAFSYLEYLRIAGLNIDCPELFFDDLSGSKSHRNGICRVLGRDDLDWHKSNPEITTHPQELVSWVEIEAANLLAEAKERFSGRDFISDVNYFTLESTFCTFKSFFRENRRYPNVYNDMLFNRIKKAESLGWEDHDINFDIFWYARRASLPQYLRLEDNPQDPGLSKEKQNNFRLTGESVMIGLQFPELSGKFEAKYYTK